MHMHSQIRKQKYTHANGWTHMQMGAHICKCMHIQAHKSLMLVFLIGRGAKSADVIHERSIMWNMMQNNRLVETVAHNSLVDNSCLTDRKLIYVGPHW